MSRKFYQCMVALICVAAGACQPFAVARADESNFPSLQTRSNDDLDSAMAAGRQLESQQRWQEAISHYEKASRKHQGNSDLDRRLQIVRVRYDVWRRYTDASFISTVDRTSPQAALNLLAEVLNKLDLYYVDAINLQDLLRNGTVFLEVALQNRDFLDQNVSHVPAEAIEEFRLNVHQLVLNRNVRTTREAQEIVMQVANHARNSIGCSPSAVIYEYVAGAIGILDPYSAFLTAGEYNEIMSQIEGNLIGIGVELWADKEDLEIVEVFEGGPASQSGLRSGDRILAVDTQPVLMIGAKRAADLLRGPEETQVILDIEHSNGEVQTLQVNRRRIEVPSVTDIHIIDAKQSLGYLRISNFQKTTANEVDEALIKLTNQGMRMLLIDLRRNPGGLLDSAVDIADRFLPNGGIVSTKGRNGAENHNFVAHYANTTSLPLMVMIDEDSASASEIFAGAMRDNNRALIVGRTSYGKGSVQGVFHNEAGQGGIRLTVSKFFSPAGYAISSRGVIPHREFPAASDLEEILVAKQIANDANADRTSDRRVKRMEKQRADDHDLQLAIDYARTVTSTASNSLSAMGTR